jgi:hypothetical protein
MSLLVRLACFKLYMKEHVTVYLFQNYGSPWRKQLHVVVELVTLLPHIREVPYSNWRLRPAILTEVFYGFPQSLQENSGIVPVMTPSFHVLSNS